MKGLSTSSFDCAGTNVDIIMPNLTVIISSVFFQAQYCDHYKAASKNYDSFHSGYNMAVVDAISRYVMFSAGDHVADVGGGTGEIGRLLREKFKLSNPVLCVDPSEKMLEIAQQKEGIETLQATAEEFFSKCLDGREFNKILMNACYHHFRDPGKVFEGVARMLSPDGVCLVSNRTSDSAPGALMFTKAQAQSFKQTDFDQLAKLAESKGLRARVTFDCQSCEIEKEHCIGFLQNRLVSTLAKYSDDEIEEGIREMTEKYKDCEVLKGEYKFKIAIITKLFIESADYTYF